MPDITRQVEDMVIEGFTTNPSLIGKIDAFARNLGVQDSYIQYKHDNRNDSSEEKLRHIFVLWNSKTSQDTTVKGLLLALKGVGEVTNNLQAKIQSLEQSGATASIPPANQAKIQSLEPSGATASNPPTNKSLGAPNITEKYFRIESKPLSESGAFEEENPEALGRTPCSTDQGEKKTCVAHSIGKALECGLDMNGYDLAHPKYSVDNNKNDSESRKLIINSLADLFMDDENPKHPFDFDNKFIIVNVNRKEETTKKQALIKIHVKRLFKKNKVDPAFPKLLKAPNDMLLVLGLPGIGHAVYATEYDKNSGNFTYLDSDGENKDPKEVKDTMPNLMIFSISADVYILQ